MSDDDVLKDSDCPDCGLDKTCCTCNVNVHNDKCPICQSDDIGCAACDCCDDCCICSDDDDYDDDDDDDDDDEEEF